MSNNSTPSLRLSGGDHLGSSSFITDDAGAVYQHLEYFPYGETWVDEGGTGQMPHYRFTGKELDPETGLYYYGARYYDPVLSRWISADPILDKYLPSKDRNLKLPGFGGIFNPLNVAMYSYSFQNPVKYLDPDGNAPNQAGVTNPSVILNELKAYESAGMTHTQALSALSRAHGGNQDRYFYTDNYGWVDVRHFGKAGELGKEKGSNVSVEVLGVLNEAAQWLEEWGNDYRSGFSPEDIPSNAAGARFGAKLKDTESLSSQFEKWLKNMGGRDITDPRANVQGLPLTDPSERGGKNRGSSNPSSVGPGAHREVPEIDYDNMLN